MLEEGGWGVVKSDVVTALDLHRGGATIGMRGLAARVYNFGLSWGIEEPAIVRKEDHAD